MNTPSFLTSHELLLEEQGRLRVARQLTSILIDWYSQDKLKTLTVLDYGCSNGVITNHMAGSVKEIVGIDVDAVAIERAEKKYGRKNYRKKSLSFKINTNIKIPYKNNSFDLVICNQVYSYLDNPKLMVKEIYRVLKMGGVCLFTGDNLLRPIEPLYNLPFIRLFPKPLTVAFLKALGYKNIYIGSYMSYWGLIDLCRKFTIHDYTIKILKNPSKFGYGKFEKFEKVFVIIPEFTLKFLEPFFPSFVFLLEKKTN